METWNILGKDSGRVLATVRPDKGGRFRVSYQVDDRHLRETLAARPRTVSVLGGADEVIDGQEVHAVVELKFTFKELPVAYMGMLDEWLSDYGYCVESGGRKLTRDLEGDDGGGQIWPYGPIDDLDDDLPLYAAWEMEEDQQLLFKSAFNEALRDRSHYVDYEDAMRRAADVAWRSVGVTDDTLFEWLAKHEAEMSAPAGIDDGRSHIASVTDTTGEIRGVQVRWVSVIVAGHTVEQVLSYDVAEAEAVHGRPFDDEMDRFMQMGMFATDRIATDGTMFKVASAASYVLDGKCIRTAKIEHCDDIKPDSASWIVTKADGTPVEQEPWSCVRGTSPIAHRELTALEGNLESDGAD